MLVGNDQGRKSASLLGHSFYIKNNDMKKLLLLALLLPLFAPSLKADLGSCVVYHAKFYLKNGLIFNGCFEVSGYGIDAYLDENGSNGFCNDKGVFYQLKKKQREFGRVPVFKNLHYVQPRPMRKGSEAELPTYGFVTPEDWVYVDSNDVSKMIFWSVEYSKRYWLTSDIISGSNGLMDTINHQRYWNHLFFTSDDSEKGKIVYNNFDYIDGPYSGFALYNYNAQINLAELKRLVNLKFPVNTEDIIQNFKRKHKIKDGQAWTPKQQQLYEDILNQKAQSLRAWFWKKGILMVAVYGTC